MKTVKHRIEIWKRDGGEYFTRLVSLGPCPHCLGYELIVSDVEVSGMAPENCPQAVHCGGCGARGPWGGTEEGAVMAWNNTTGVRTFFDTDWRIVPRSPATEDGDAPF